MPDKSKQPHPAQRFPATIADMRLGDCAFTDPNALAPLRDGTCFLLGTFAVFAVPDAVARMRIERITGGWLVYASEVSNSNWRISRGLPWPGVDERDLMPVARIV
jgi:hypothetical protein